MFTLLWLWVVAGWVASVSLRLGEKPSPVPLKVTVGTFFPRLVGSIKHDYILKVPLVWFKHRDHL